MSDLVQRLRKYLHCESECWGRCQQCPAELGAEAADEGRLEPTVGPLVAKRDTLCDACAKHFAWCKSDPTFAATGDAVVACASFEAAMPVGWKCYFCDYRGNGQYDTFCGNCRRHR